MRQKRRYLLLSCNESIIKNITKKFNPEAGLRIIESEERSVILRCNLLYLRNILQLLNSEGIEILTLSGTLRALRAKKGFINKAGRDISL